MEADGVGPREDRAGLDDRRADEGDGEDNAHRPDEAIESDADPCGGGVRLVGGIGRRGLFRSRHEDGGTEVVEYNIYFWAVSTEEDSVLISDRRPQLHVE